VKVAKKEIVRTIALLIVAAQWILVPLSRGHAQVDSVLSYLPLQTGNLWQYHYHYSNSCGNQHSSYYTEEVVGDTILPNGYAYKVIISDLPFQPHRYLRVDTATANVYEYFAWGEQLVDSLRATVGSMFVREDGFYTQCVAIDTAIVLGLPTTVKRFVMFYVFGGDYALAHGLGRSEFTTYHEDPCYPLLVYYYRDLVYARIEGVEHGTLVDIDDAPEILPGSFKLFQNYPNPFNPSTTIRYELPEKSLVTINIYSVLGEEIATLVNEGKDVGSYQVRFDGTGLSSGVYFYRMRARDFVETKKLLLLR
jgi:hypothetical protein